MAERTHEEWAHVIPLEVDLESAERIERELLRKYPPYRGPKDHNPTVEENAADIIQRLAQRLRDMDGERIEGILYDVFTEFQDWDGYLSPGPIRPLFDKWFPSYTGDKNPEAVFLAKHVATLILNP